MCITIARPLTFFFCFLFLFLFEAYGQNINKAQIALQYYQQGELEKAKNTYEDLAKSRANIPFIHKIYFDLLLSEKDQTPVFNYINKVKKWYPDNLNYSIDEGLAYSQFKHNKKAEDIFKEVIKTAKSNPTLVRTAAQYFFQQSLTPYAVEMYLAGRNFSKNPNDYSIELANLYRRINNKEGMVQEYLNFVHQNTANHTYVQNILQSVLTETEDIEALEKILYSRIQKYPDYAVYNELLVWANIQLKNFNGAFIQARAIDKIGNEGGNRLVDIGVIALQNGDYENAEKIFSYVIQTYKSGMNYEIARRYLIKCREEIIKNTFPIDKEAIAILIGDYQQLIKDLGINQITLEAMRSQALLHAFYLDQKDSAIHLLEKVVNTPRVDPQLSANAKIDMGDIYLLKNEPWESTLLYAQVEKSAKETRIGYEAKLKNAQLSYYKGDFELAQAHLDVLKLATSREIANDAMALSLLIQNNIVFDTTQQAMRQYASIDLLLFQHKEEEALARLDSMLVEFPGHSLTDEILWRKAEILLKKGNYNESIALLEQIVAEYPYDVLGDDAYFLMASIYEDYLGEEEKAMELYQAFLIKYPGSLFSSEARKRFRNLRGDFSNTMSTPALNN